MVDVVRDVVRQISVLGVIPALFDRVLYGGIRRKEFEGKPVRIVRFEVPDRAAMHIPAVQDNDGMMTVMSVQQPKQCHHPVRVDVLGREMEIE